MKRSRRYSLSLSPGIYCELMKRKPNDARSRKGNVWHFPSLRAPVFLPLGKTGEGKWLIAFGSGRRKQEIQVTTNRLCGWLDLGFFFPACG